jgi:NAD-dependent deacetylase
MEYATIDAFRRDPRKVWRMLAEVDALVRAAAPNPGHVALAELERRGVVQAIVTQNIDGLHQRAGSGEVIEFHGGSERLRCLGCDRTWEAAAFPRGRVPECDLCQVPLKPDVVFFGEAIPPRVLADAFRLAGESDAVLVVGTSATVSPAAEVAVLAKRAGAVLLEFNLERTPLSGLADVCVTGSASETLPALVQALG